MLSEEQQKQYNYIDAQLYNYLYSHKMAPAEALRAALMETTINGEALGVILVRNGFLSQEEIVDSMIELKPEYLGGRQKTISSCIGSHYYENTFL